MAAKGKTSTLDVGRFPTQRAPWRPAGKTCIQSQTAAPVKTRVRGCVSFSGTCTGGLEHSNQFPHRGLQASDVKTRVGLFSWDEENRLISAKRTSDSVVLGSYKYDALGRRVQKTSTEGTRTYVLSGAQVVQEYLGTVLERSYVYGTYVDEVLVQMTGAGVKNYFHTNHLYSTAALTNSAGAVVERYGYDAYGKRVTLDADGALRTAPAMTTVGFTGRTLDSETGLWYFRARYYSDSLNRFIGRDPAGYVDGMSEYNSYFIPKSKDPTGLGIGRQIFWYFFFGVFSEMTWDHPTMPGGWVSSSGPRPLLTIWDRGGEMASALEVQLWKFRSKLTEKFKNGECNDSWQEYTGGGDAIAASGESGWAITPTGLFSLGWWLHGAHAVRGVWGFEWKKECCPKDCPTGQKKFCYRNFRSTLIWLDDIDARSDDGAIERWWDQHMEGGLDSRLNTSFPIKIYFTYNPPDYCTCVPK